MRKKTLQNLLHLPVGAGADGVYGNGSQPGLTQAQADPTAAAAQVVEDTQAAAGNTSAGELSASIPSRWAASPLACIAGFVVVLAFVAGGLLLYRRERRQRGAGAPQGETQLHPPRGHGLFRQKQSIGVFVLSYFTSKQGRLHRRSCFYQCRKKASHWGCLFLPPGNIPAYLFGRQTLPPPPTPAALRRSPPRCRGPHGGSSGWG